MYTTGGGATVMRLNEFTEEDREAKQKAQRPTESVAIDHSVAG